MNKNYKISDYFTGDTLFDKCDLIEVTFDNKALSPELSVLIPSLSITIVNNKETFSFYRKNNERRAVKVEIEDVIYFEGVLEPISFLYLDSHKAILEISSPLTLLSIESDNVIWEGFIRKFGATSIYNKEAYSIINVIVDYVNELLPEKLRMLKINSDSSEIIRGKTETFLIPENTNILELLGRLCFEFSFHIYYDKGIVVRDIKSEFTKKYDETLKCFDRESYSIERVKPSKNRLTLVYTNKNYKGLTEVIEEDIKGIWNEMGTRDENNKLYPVKPLFENQYYPENSDEFEEKKIITKGFLIDVLVKTKDENKILITSKDLRTEISPILLIQDPVILFNPYNEWFKLVDKTKHIKSKSELISDNKIAENTKAYAMLEKYYPTDKSDWKPIDKEKSYLMLNDFKSGGDWIAYSFHHQPKEAWDITKPALININWIQVIASTHYRGIEWTLRSGEKYYTREEYKDLYLYVNDETTAKEEYSFRQYILLNGYETIRFSYRNKLNLFKKYKVYNPKGQDFIVWIIQEYIQIQESKEVYYSYIAYVVFDINDIPKYNFIITSKNLDIGKKEEPLLLKTRWDVRLRPTLWEHWYIDDVPAITFEKVKSAYIALFQNMTMYFINRIPEVKDTINRPFGDIDELTYIVPKEEMSKVKEYFERETEIKAKLLEVSGVISKGGKPKHTIKSNWKGAKIGDGTYFALPFRTKFRLEYE